MSSLLSHGTSILNPMNSGLLKFKTCDVAAMCYGMICEIAACVMAIVAVKLLPVM